MDSGNADAFIGTVLLMVVFYIGLIALGIILTVFTYITYYKVYRSCSPDNAVLFLVLSILFSFLTPFFLFACRNKDDGLAPGPAAAVSALWRTAAVHDAAALFRRCAAGMTEKNLASASGNRCAF
ncbi:MAG: hypothetical protein V8Q43_00305 [Christensenellaceae bacterium]